MPQQIRQHPSKNSFLIETATNVWEEVEKTKPDISELYQSYTEDFAVLGGGPSLPNDLMKVKGCKMISANHHALRIIDTEFMVFLDPVTLKSHTPEFRAAIKREDIIKFSPKNLNETDYYCIDAKCQSYSDTGIFATWIACYLTSGNVYICGCDLRTGDRMHFYPTQPAWGGPTYKLRLNRWLKLKEEAERPERIKAVSGPLMEHFK